MSVIDLYVNDVVRYGVEWSMSFEEVLGGQGRSTLTIQDRTNTWEPDTHDDIKAVVSSTGWVLFRGEVISEPVELPVAHPWRKWGMECSDYNNQLALRLVGAIDGTSWQDADGYGDYIAIDPWAHSARTDRMTIQALFDHYIRIHGEAIDTDTFVGEYLVDFAMIYWTYSTLDAVVAELASFIAKNLQSWLDPDLKYHWVVIPSWRDLAQDVAAILVDSSSAPMARMLPEVSPTQQTQLTVITPSIDDGFSRNGSGWGVADSGQSWLTGSSGTAPDDAQLSTDATAGGIMYNGVGSGGLSSGSAHVASAGGVVTDDFDILLEVSLRDESTISPDFTFKELSITANALRFGWHGHDENAGAYTWQDHAVPEWQANHDYSGTGLDDWIVVPTGGGLQPWFRLRFDYPGMSGSVEPSWVPGWGAQVTDGDVTWVCQPWDAWAPFSQYVTGTLKFPSAVNGHVYQVVAADFENGWSSFEEPAWPTDGSTVVEQMMSPDDPFWFIDDGHGLGSAFESVVYNGFWTDNEYGSILIRAVRTGSIATMRAWQKGTLEPSTWDVVATGVDTTGTLNGGARLKVDATMLTDGTALARRLEVRSAHLDSVSQTTEIRDLMGFAPAMIWMDGGGPPGSISGRGLKFTYDGSDQPEQAYIRGKTGFTYDNGQDPSIINATPPPVDKTPGTYKLTFLLDTPYFFLTSDGYIDDDLTPSTVPSGLSCYARIRSVPVNPDPASLHRFGDYYAMVDGLYAGFLVPVSAMDGVNGTAELVAQADPGTGGGGGGAIPPPPGSVYITYTVKHGDTLWAIAGVYYGNPLKWPTLYKLNKAVIDKTAKAHGYTSNFAHWIFPGEKLQVPRKGGGTPNPPPLPPAPTTPPSDWVDPVVTIGVGGTGWSSSVEQDPNKRQVYVDAPQSTTEDQRNAIGAQVLYRGQYPTLRGTVTVSGVDGWRCGQLVQICDVRLPTALNGKFFVIQRVASRLIAGNDVREYDIDWGDGSVGRSTTQQPKPIVGNWVGPLTKIVILTKDVSPKPNESQVIVGQLSTMSGDPIQLSDRVVNWDLVVLDGNNNVVVGQGFIAPSSSTTDASGQARTKLTTGSRTGLTYYVYGDTPVV